MATEPYEPLNVHIYDDSAGCCSSTKYYVLRYDTEGKDNPSWNIVPFNSEYRIEFKATGHGKTYCDRSQPFPYAIMQMMEINKKSLTKDNYEVRIEKDPSFDLRRYFP
ncbi:uncharacterized protein LOC124275195 isoform X2 [Haliotis rubra]|nr:uncharacterized protein LOC124275195 isoform X2 [Haliotis rubra]